MIFVISTISDRVYLVLIPSRHFHFNAVPFVLPNFAAHIMYTIMQIQEVQKGMVGLPHLSFGALFKVVFPSLSSSLEIQHTATLML